MKIINTIIIALTLLFSVNASAQPGCTREVLQEADNEVKNYVSNYPLNIKNVSNSYSKTVCITIDEIPTQDFVIIGDFIEYSPQLMSKIPKNTEYGIIRMFNKEKGYYCEHVFYRQFGSSNSFEGKPANLIEAEKRLRTAENTLEARRSELKALKKQQKEIVTDNVNLLGDVLISVVPSTDIKDLDSAIEKALTELKKKGINKMSGALDIYYEPSTNENAELVRKIITPIDKALSVKGVSLKKFNKYWEIIKRTPELGMIIGNSAAQLKIYMRQKDLEKEISRLESDVKKEKENVKKEEEKVRRQNTQNIREEGHRLIHSNF